MLSSKVAVEFMAGSNTSPLGSKNKIKQKPTGRKEIYKQEEGINIYQGKTKKVYHVRDNSRVEEILGMG